MSEPAAPAFDPYEDLLARAREQGGLPAVGHVFERLLRLLESDSEAVKELTDLVLADVALTQRLLQFANTVPFRAGQGPVMTVTRAIVLLGFNRVRATVVSLVMLDGLVGPGHSTRVRAEFRAALVAGSLAREILVDLDADEAEIAAIAAMFRSVGRLLLAIFDPGAWARIEASVRDERLAEPAAARRAIGHSLEDLGEAVLREWRVPDRMLGALQPVPVRPEAPRDGPGRIRIAAQLADEVATLLRRADPALDRDALEAVLERFAPALAVDTTRLGVLLDAALARVDAFEASCGVAAPPPPPLLRRAGVAAAWRELDAAAAAGAGAGAESAGLVPVTMAANGSAGVTLVLASALAQASSALASAPDAPTALRHVVPGVLRSIQHGLGFRRVALVLRETAGGRFRPRVMAGGPVLDWPPALDAEPDRLAAALADGRDRYLDDLVAQRGSLPAPLRDLGTGTSLLLLPLMVPGRLLGFILADRDRRVPAGGPGPEHFELLRALRSQILLALRFRGGATRP